MVKMVLLTSFLAAAHMAVRPGKKFRNAGSKVKSKAAAEQRSNQKSALSCFQNCSHLEQAKGEARQNNFFSAVHDGFFPTPQVARFSQIH